MNTKTFKKSFTKNASQQTLGKFDQNATQTRTKKYALPLVVVTAVLLAFCSPAVADYSGDHPLTIYDHDTINGSLVYETITDGSGYTTLNAISSATYSQDITINIPAGATVKRARLYNTYCWSKSDFGDPNVPGDPAEAVLTFNGVKVTCQNPAAPIPNPIHYGNGVVHYWDTKNLSKYGGQYDYPSGEFAWDVTDMVTGSGTYTATIANNDSTPTPNEYFCTFGFGLLVVYEKPSAPEIEYWIAEGCDILMARTFETPENATTSATFVGSIDLSNVSIANLTAVTTCSDGGLMSPPKNMMYFNDVEIGPATAAGISHYGVNHFDVTSVLSSTQNVVEFQDRDDDHYVHNAFLVVEYEEAGICGDVDGKNGITTADGRRIYMNLLYGSGEYPIVNLWAADVDCKNGITTADGRRIYMNLLYGSGEYPLNCC